MFHILPTTYSDDKRHILGKAASKNGYEVDAIHAFSKGSTAPLVHTDNKRDLNDERRA